MPAPGVLRKTASGTAWFFFANLLALKSQPTAELGMWVDLESAETCVADGEVPTVRDG